MKRFFKLVKKLFVNQKKEREEEYDKYLWIEYKIDRKVHKNKSFLTGIDYPNLYRVY